MAVTSWGYGQSTPDPEGTITPEAPWAQLLGFGGGSQYWVQYSGAVNVAGSTDGTRHYTVSAGFFGGFGVLDQNPSTYTGTLSASVGADKFWMIVAHRDWTTDPQVTTFTAIDAGTTPDTLPTRSTAYGTTDDQPLAMVRVTTAGQVIVYADLRVIKEGSNGICQAFSELVTQYMNFIGTRIAINGVEWTCKYPSPGGSRGWVTNPGPYGKVDLSSVTVSSGIGSSATDWATSPFTQRAIHNGNEAEVNLYLRYSGPTVTPNAYGNITDKLAFTLNTAWWPSTRIPVTSMIYRNTAQQAFPATGYLTPAGEFWLTTLWPGVPLPTTTDNSRYTVHVQLKYTQRS